jgi:hypothetical protein
MQGTGKGCKTFARVAGDSFSMSFRSRVRNPLSHFDGASRQFAFKQWSVIQKYIEAVASCHGVVFDIQPARRRLFELAAGIPSQ